MLIVKFIVTKDKDFSSFKSPGLDDVYLALLKWGLNALLTSLVGIFSASLAMKYIHGMERSQSDLYTKNRKDGLLLSFISKTLERLIESYIRKV